MAQQNGKNDVNEEAILGLVIVLMVALIFAFQYYFEHLANLWRLFRYYEFYFFQYIPDFSIPLIGHVSFSNAVEWLDLIRPESLDIETIANFDRTYMPWIAVPMGLFLCIKGGLSTLNEGVSGKIEDMESVAYRFSKIYPYLHEIYTENPQKKPLKFNRKLEDSYRWAKGVTPFQYAVAKPPFGLEKEAKKNHSYKRPIWKGDDDFDEDLAERSFASQLGPPWQGEDSLTDYEKDIFYHLKSILATDSETVAPIVNNIWRVIKKQVIKKKHVPEKIMSKNLTDKEILFANKVLERYRLRFELFTSNASDSAIKKKLKINKIKKILSAFSSY